MRISDWSSDVCSSDLKAEPLLEHKGQHARPMGIGVGPDMAAIGKKAVGLALQKGRVGEQGGGERLKRKADAELLHHVRLAAIVEVGLDGAGPQQIGRAACRERVCQYV